MDSTTQQLITSFMSKIKFLERRNYVYLLFYKLSIGVLSASKGSLKWKTSELSLNYRFTALNQRFDSKNRVFNARIIKEYLAIKGKYSD